VAVADLEEINMASYNVALEIQIESSPAVIANLFLGEKHRHFHRHRHGIVDQQEALQCFVTVLVVWRRWSCKSGGTGSVIFLPGHRRVKVGREFRGAMPVAWKK
jgi:hypothetical protein